MRRAVATVLIATFFMTNLAPLAAAQEFGPPPPKEKAPQPVAVVLDPANPSLVACDARGIADAKERGTGGSMAGGFCGGLLLGLIGTGAAVLMQSSFEPSPAELAAIEDAGDECQYVYLDAYRDELRSRKRSAALTGGLIGTVVIVSVLLAASNGSEE